MNTIIRGLATALATLFASHAFAGVSVINFDTDSGGNATVSCDAIGTNLVLTIENYNDEISKLGTAVDCTDNFNTIQVSVQDRSLGYNSGIERFSYAKVEIDSVGFDGAPRNISITQNIEQRNDSLANCANAICAPPNNESNANPAKYFEFNFNKTKDIVSLDTFKMEGNGEFVVQFFANSNMAITEANAGLSDAVQQEAKDGEFVRQILHVVGVKSMKTQPPDSGTVDN